MTMLPFGQIAPISRRAVAYVLDALIAAGLAIVLSGILVTIAVLSGSVEGMLLILAIGAPVVVALEIGWLLVYTYMQVGAGSIGMRAQGVRLVDAATGDSIGFGRALLRNVIFWLAGSIVVGYFTPLFDGTGRYQGWHDKVAKTLVIDARVSAPTAPATQAMPLPPVPEAGGVGGQPPLSPGYPAPPTGQPFPQPPAGQPFPQSPAPALPFGNPAPAQPSFAAPAPPLPETAPAAPDLSSSALDETIVPPRPPLPVTPEPAPQLPADSSLIAFVPGITQDAPLRPAPAASAEPPSEEAAAAAPETAETPVPASGTSAETPAAAAITPAEEDDVEQTRISIPGHRLVFTWDDGARVSVSRRTVFGRNPASEEGAVIVPVRDETLSLSKTHFEAAADTSGGWLMDRNSTNGTTIIRDGVQITCTPGERVRIKLGDVISIGDRIVTVGGYE
ncbi:RDD family protein [Microbacterium sp. CIAB417]|uniref:RDD family protein n=1 Tax=Microbacterium sp. CIAB417 TaxID=2860287 RepID=UPI001FAB9579|nr:RDD family protein [Microbacterium sp. CIAB417]